MKWDCGTVRVLMRVESRGPEAPVFRSRKRRAAEFHDDVSCLFSTFCIASSRRLSATVIRHVHEKHDITTWHTSDGADRSSKEREGQTSVHGRAHCRIRAREGREHLARFWR